MLNVISRSVVALSFASALVAPVSALAEPVPASCGPVLSSAASAEVAELSDTSTIGGADGLAKLEEAVARHHRITELFEQRGDRRGAFATGLDVVEGAAVMPLQRDPQAFADPDYAHRLSYDLLRRFLDNVHAEFTGGTPEPHWANYFTLAADCSASPARVALAGYNAHLVIDLPRTVAATGSTPADAGDYFKIVASIAATGDLITERTDRIYQAKMGPLWRFYFVGEGLDSVLGKGVATTPMLVVGDLAANTTIFANGLALANPALAPAISAEIEFERQTAERAFDILAQLNGI
ncbi:DUF5995 family protein [Nocardia seriolae]|uniref:Uncharacterized protein n=1 Tax=Nocardia seriolae TaxID=37332 RepID=A0ABC9YSE8_9NOCA|nr:DUF5995 family protein [Nocardia seriolae]APA96472.1 hypothetical protein NS506_02407 [Nocardia seriolae]WKY51177.1 DUF5995 family protein [Nocardia seriolae]WNJ57866.1 DUF5995 family protein [Nocardia seriolae]BEK90513.1 hypothetical protein NSERKGN1266_64640 [Nocardia seriolae]BEK98262.1 hypothetical protein NSER024013_61680 [Nocardia seriolae]